MGPETLRKESPGPDILTPALLRGGVHTGVKGERRDEIFGEVLNALPLPASVDKLSLKAMLISSEQVGTTGIGNGIAIPHVKHPVIFAGLDPIVGLFFLEKPVNFAAPDGERVHTLFVILSGSFRGICRFSPGWLFVFRTSP